MSKWTQKRKRRYLSIFLLVVIAFVSLIVYQITNRPPTCFDGEQNGQETGVDCGGSCQLVCREEVRNVVVWWERPFQVRSGASNTYNLVGYIENQNLEFGLRELEYEFRVYNRDNLLIAEPVVGTTFVEPNRRSAIFAPSVATGAEEAYTVFLRLNDDQTWERTDQAFTHTLFEVGERDLRNQDSSPRLTVPITNATFIDFDQVSVVAILYNEEGNAVASSQTYLDALGEGDTKQARFSWPEPFEEEISRIEIIPRVNPFSSY
jgi:hypothetical protein